MNAAAIRARDAMVARGFTEHEAIALLLPVIGEAYREVADEANESAEFPSAWGSTVPEAFRAFADAFTKSANDLDPPISPDLRGGFWPGMTGGMCARCHLAVNRSEDPDPEHPVCAVIADGMRITTDPPQDDLPDTVTIHLPYWTTWDTQAYSADVGIPAGHLPALQAVLSAWLAQRAADTARVDGPTP